jgi:hypothetical protein
MTTPIDYASILADLEAKKAALEATIASIHGAIAVGSLGQPGDGNGYTPSGLPTSLNGGEVPAGAFFGKSILDATKLYLEIVKKKQTSKEIAAALLKGGMESTSKNFPSIVHSILDRARKGANPAFVKLGTQWGLASWYPNLVPSVNGQKTEKKKTEKKAAKKKARPKATAKTGTPVAASNVSPVSIGAQTRANGKPVSPTTQRITDLIRAKPGLTLKEIAKEAAMDTQSVNRVIVNIVRSGKAEKTADGKYRAVA